MEAIVEYDGFISYSHEADGELAPALRTGLQRFAKPWWRRRAITVFCDTNDLSATPALWASIQRALDDSRYLVVLASPASAASPWAGHEINHWRAHREPGTILLALSAGELRWDNDAHDFDPTASTALHPSLRGAFDEEPLWVDLRQLSDPSVWRLRDSAFAMAIARLSAPLRSTTPDALIGDDLRLHRRALRLGIAAALVTTAFARAGSLPSRVALGRTRAGHVRKLDALVFRGPAAAELRTRA